MSDVADAPQPKGFLGWVEKTGNKLPDPVFIFFYLIIFLVGISIVADLINITANHPTQVNADGSPKVEDAVSLLSPENIQRLWVEMPKTFTHFHPLGYVLVVMLGAGVAERSGLFASGIRQAVRGAPRFLLTPVVALVAMLSNHAADAGYVVMIPLAAILFASMGRHPLAGVATAFAGVSGGFSANVSPGQLDALLFGITETAYASSNIDAGWSMNIAGNWWFIVALMFIYLPVIWYVTDRIIEPRLGKWAPEGADAAAYSDEDKPLTEEQHKGLSWAGLAILGVILFWALMTFAPGTPLLNDGSMKEGLSFFEEWAAVLKVVAISIILAVTWMIARVALKFSSGSLIIRLLMKLIAIAVLSGAAILGSMWVISTGPGLPTTGVPGQEWYVTATPFFQSLVAGFLILFLAAGWAYGAAANTINNHRDLVNMMAEAMKDMGYYLVLAFAAAHFVAMFGWSNLGLISAVHGADAIQNSGLPLPIVLGMIVLFSAMLNLFVGSASAKWALMAPVLVPMLILLGISPDGATAAYRVGDGATNIITPLMVYFPLILVFARRWKADFGLGSLTAMMIPYSIWLLVSGVALMMIWIFLGLDLGPGAPAQIPIPGAN